MSLYKIQITGEKPNLDKDAEKEFRKDARYAIRIGVNMQINAVKNLLQSQPGRLVSRPGEPPLLHSGKLLKSFKRLPLKIGRLKASGGIYSDHPGAGRLEWGDVDQDGIRTFPHPYLEPSQREVEPKVDKMLENFLVELNA